MDIPAGASKRRSVEVVGRALAAGRRGLQFDPTLTYERWRDIGAALGSVARASGWIVGDWVLHGQTAYGRKYTTALEVTGLDYKSLRNYAYLAARFDVSRRRDTLSLGHHEAVAALPEDEQERWLDLAEERGMTRQQLRDALRGMRDRSGAVIDIVFLKLAVSPERELRWREAADLAEVDLDEWILQAADAAADAHARERIAAVA